MEISLNEEDCVSAILLLNNILKSNINRTQKIKIQQRRGMNGNAGYTDTR